MSTYTGGCHCGRVRFEVSGQIERVLDCNCSICRKKGFLHWIVEPERFHLLSSSDALSSVRISYQDGQALFLLRVWYLLVLYSTFTPQYDRCECALSG